MSSERLHVLDQRTGRTYDIPIEHNAIRASDFSSIKLEGETKAPFVDQVSDGLRVYDDGFQNTAVRKSRITFLDATKGRLYYRGHDIATLVGNTDFEDIFNCLVWGDIPSSSRKEWLKHELARAAKRPPQHVFDIINAYL